MRLDNELERFITDCGYWFVRQNGDHLEWAYSDVRQVLRRTREGYAIFTIERGVEYPRARFTTTSWPALERAVVVLEGSAWRFDVGLPKLPAIMSTAEPLGVEVREAVPDAEMHWTDPDGNIHCAGGMILPWTQQLAYFLGFPLSDVIATYRSPKGHPIFD